MRFRKLYVILITQAKMLDENFESSQTSSNIIQNDPTP